MRPILAVILLVCPCFAATSFKAQVAPILLEKCIACHGPEKAKGGFRLDTFGLLMKSGESGKTTVVPSFPQRSHLYQLVTAQDEDDRMPQKGDRLTEDQIGVIRDWISEGATFDGGSPEQNLAAMVPFQPGPEPLEHYPFPQPILALAWSADGKRLASSGYHEALIWNDEGKLLKRVSRLSERIHGLAFVENNLMAVAAGTPGKSGEALLCRTDSEEPPRLLARIADVMTCLTVDQSRTMMAAGGADNAIRIFDLPSGKEGLVIQQHADWVTGLAFSADGSKLASASRDRTARIFDTKTGELIETYPEHDQPIFSVTFSSDGKTVFSGGRGRRIHAWQAHEAKKSGEFPAFNGEVLALCVAGPDLFAAGGDKDIVQFTAENRKKVRSLSGHTDWIFSLAWHEGSKRLASGSYNGEIRLWDTGKGESTLSFKAAP